MQHHMSQFDIERDFKDFLSSINHPLDDSIDFYKIWVRYACPHSSERNNEDVAYTAYADGKPHLLVQCHKCHSKIIKHPYGNSQNASPISPEELKRQQESSEKRKALADKKSKESIQKKDELLASAITCINHPYLKYKQVIATPEDGLLINQKTLLVPVKNISGEIVSLLRIWDKGKLDFEKRFLCASSDGFHVLGKLEDSDTFLFVEGPATGLTVKEATGLPIICVLGKRFDTIGQIIRKKYPNANFIFCAEVSHKTHEVETSEANAKKACAFLGVDSARYVLPDFSCLNLTLEQLTKNTDLNDLFCAMLNAGFDRKAAHDEVKRQILNANKEEDMISDQSEKETGEDQKQEVNVEMPPNFKLTDTGLIFEKKDKEGKVEVISVTKRFIKILGRQHDYYSGENFGLLFEFEDENSKRKVWVMPSTLMSDAKALETALNYRGFYVHDIKKLITFFKASKTNKSYIGVSRIGWHVIKTLRYFTLPGAVIGNGIDQKLIRYQTTDTKHPFHSNGKIEDWQNKIGYYLAGQSRILFGVSFSLSSLLLDIVGAENGGVHFHGISSKGKTTLLLICASLFGDPESYKLSWKATPNSTERLAVSRHDCPLIIDESSEFENEQNRKLASVIYMLMNGSGKSRLNPDSSLKDTLTWRCNVMSSGENPISQLLIDAGERDNEGVAVRMIDLPAIVGEHGVFDFIPQGFKDGHEFSNYLKEAVQKFHGTIVIEFLKLLIAENPEEIKASVKKIEEKIIASLDGAQGQVMRCVKRFALAACTGELAHNILGIKEGEATKAAIDCLKVWIKTRGGVRDNEATKLLSKIIAYRDAHNARFKTIGDDSSYEKDCQSGYKEKQGGRWVHYVTSDTFKEMTKTFSHEFSIETLLKAGFITEDKTKNGNRRYLRQKKIDATNSKYYFFDGVMWNMAEPEEVTR